MESSDSNRDKKIALDSIQSALDYLEGLNGTESSADSKPAEFSLEGALRELQIVIEGPGYDGQLTGELAKALGQYQDAIYAFAKIVICENPNARLTVEQKKKLELLIEVSEGCLDLKVDFGKLFVALKEPLSKMSPNTAAALLISLALIATVGITSYTLGSRALENNDRAGNREHVEEMLRMTLDSNNKTIDKALDLLDSQLSRETPQKADHARSAVSELAKAQTIGLTEIAKASPDADEISFGSSRLDKEAIKTIGQRSPRAIAERFDWEGSYRVLAETLPGKVTKVTFHGKDLPGEITVDFVEDEFTKQQSDFLWAAIRGRTSVHVKLQATLIRDTVKGGVLVDIITE